MATDKAPEEATPLDKLALAYAVVFGRDAEHRTEAQKLVMEDMERRGYLHRSTAVPMPSGEVQPLKMELAEGCRIFMLDTQRLISRATLAGQTKQKPKTKRT
jgi:hypothetical protein